MNERFTDRARKVMQLANHEAQRSNHEYIGTEHILLGLVGEGLGVAAIVLKNIDVDLRKIRLEVEKLVQSGPDMVTIRKLNQTPRAKKVIEYAIDEARNFHHDYIGTEHLLLGLLREQEGVAAQVLMNLGVALDPVRQAVSALLVQGVSDNHPLPDTATRSEIIAKWDPADPDLPEVRYFNAEIDRLNQEKESAVAGQDFEKAAHLLDQVDKLKTLKAQFVSKWWDRIGPIPSLPGVQEIDTAIAQVVRERTGAIARYDSTLEKLKTERARIIAEWCKQQAASNEPPKSGDNP